MPGQEKMIFDYYQKNPSATQRLKGAIYEEKIIELMKSKIKLETKQITLKEAENLIADFNKQNINQSNIKKTDSPTKNKVKSKKISKK